MTAGPLVCRDLVELVTDHLEGALGPTVHTTVDDHLRGCAGCTAYLAQIRATVAVLRATPPPPLDPEFHARLTDAFRTWSEQREIGGEPA
jgi:anti-sigma factor RsiW